MSDSEHGRISKNSLVDLIHMYVGIRKPIQRITFSPEVFDQFVEILKELDPGLLDLEAKPFKGPIMYDGVMIYRGEDSE